VSTLESGNGEFFAGLMDDFFAECDEHLTVLRRSLLLLESFVHKADVDRELLDELFRRFHSLKGISGMVGLYESEQLAHQMESYLRSLRQHQLSLTEDGLDTLIEGMKLLEQVIAARRAETPPPNIAKIMARLGSIISVQTPLLQNSHNEASEKKLNNVALSVIRDDEQVKLDRAVQAGMKIWHIEFSPKAELTERGINVNNIRARLQEIGELIRASPRVTAGGGITFDFLVSSSADPSVFESWREDGVEFKPYAYSSVVEVKADAEDGSFIPTRTEMTALSPSNIVRVDLERLNELMRMVGELVISRSHLEQNLSQLESVMPARQLEALLETNIAFERHLRDLREGVMQIRMVPIGEIFERMQFVIRDLARESRKKIKLELIGRETKTDKYLVERMMDPLLHLVRNAVSHGIESESERIAAGKSAEARIMLRASTAAERVVIDVLDDGRGIDIKKVAERGRALGLIGQDTILDSDTILDLICSPGFSTRDDADRASGRGIGMAVVRDSVFDLGGTISVDTQSGKGTRFTIYLPLTLAIAEALIVSVGGQLYTVPQSSISEVIEIDPADITVLEKNEIVPYRDGILPLVRLSRFFGYPETETQSLYVFVIGSGLNSMGVVVDRIIGQREIVVRPITDPLIRVTGIAGATELGDGHVVLILDTAALIRIKQHRQMEGERLRSDDLLQNSFSLAKKSLNIQKRVDVDRILRSDRQQAGLSEGVREFAMPDIQTDTFILFELAGTTYGLRSRAVQQMEMIEHITPVPNAPSFVEGVIFSRGQVIPALNLRVRFGFEKIPYDLKTRLIVVNSGERLVGFIVDTAREFISIPYDAIKPLNESISGLSGDYLEGIAKLGERLVLILNLGGVTDFEISNMTMPTGTDLARLQNQLYREDKE
jgi:two-component system, chemotaxis family, sensor kinase CheA